MNRNTPKWSKLATQLAVRGVAPKSDAARFWSDFHSRLHLYPQHPAATARHPHRASWIWTLGSLGATSIMAVGAWLLFLQPAPLQAGSAIHSYAITPQHGSVMIWQEESCKATIFWISDLDFNDEARDGEASQ
jgi:hypothetical protein